MYADLHPGRYARPNRFSPQGLGGALIITGGMVIAMTFAAPHFIRVLKPEPIHVRLIPLPPDPQPIPEHPKPQPRTQQQPQEKIVTPQPLLPPPPTDFKGDTTPDPSPPTDFGTIGTGTVIAPPDPPPPLLGAEIDGRYANAFQPTYPPDETRAGREGRVVVRVLIGVDGRVKQVERVSATSDSFYAVTERQALSKWRFKPATRGGIPEQQWKTMAVSFVLNDNN